MSLLKSTLTSFLSIGAISALCVAAERPADAGLIICAVYDMEPYTGIPGHHYAMIHDDVTCDYFSSDETIANNIQDCPDCPPFGSAQAAAGNNNQSQDEPECAEEKDMRRRPTAEHPNGRGRMFFAEADHIAATRGGLTGGRPLVEIDGRKLNIIRVNPEEGEPFYAYLFVARLTEREGVDPKQLVVCEDESGKKAKFCKPAHAWLAVQAALDPNTPSDRLPGGIPLLATLDATAVDAPAGYSCPTPYALRTKSGEWPQILVALGR